MISSIMQSKIKYSYLLFLMFIFIITSGCAGPKVASDLLAHTEKNNEPLIDNSVTIDVEINPAIHNHEKIDETVKESLEIALRNANIFGADSSQPYKIKANVKIASQAAMSFGSFNGKLEIHYLLLDETNVTVIDKTIYTEAGSDVWYFSGAKRHRRARAVNISKNVLQFVNILQIKLNKPRVNPHDFQFE